MPRLYNYTPVGIPSTLKDRGHLPASGRYFPSNTMNAKRTMFAVWMLAALALPGSAQTPPDVTENWNLYYQATSIGDYHGAFQALYNGPLSLSNSMERAVSLTTTLFFSFRPE